MSYYPYNVLPQARSPQPTSPTNCLVCPPDVSQQAIIFDQTALAVVKGWETKSTTDLKEFFHPIDGYLEYQVTLKPMTEDESIKLSYGMLADETTGCVPFLAILPMWQYTTCAPESAYINWRWSGYSVLVDENKDGIQDNLNPYGPTGDSMNYEWDELGRMLIISAGPVKGVRPMELQNLSGVDVMVKILIGK